MAFVEIKKMFDTEERNPKSDFIRIYFIPPFAKKSVFQLTFENKNWVVLRKNLINDSQFWGPGRDSVKQSDFEIEALQTSEAWNQLAQFLYNSNAKYFESEIRIHPITGRDVIFFDEHLWYLEIRKGGSSNWTVWYDGSENFYQIESVVKAFAPGKL